MYKDMTAIVYSKEGCKHCKLIKEVLDLTAVKYVEYTLGEHFNKDQFVKEFGESTFPRVVIDGELIGGAKEAIAFLKDNQP